MGSDCERFNRNATKERASSSSMTVTHVSQKRAGWWAGWLSLFVLLARVNAYNLGGSHISAMQRSKLLLGLHVPSNLRTPSGLSAKRSSGSGGGAIPPTQADNIQSWGKSKLLHYFFFLSLILLLNLANFFHCYSPFSLPLLCIYLSLSSKKLVLPQISQVSS